MSSTTIAVLYLSVLVSNTLAFSNNFRTPKVPDSMGKDFSSRTRPLFSDTFDPDSAFGPISLFEPPGNQQHAPTSDDHGAENVLSTLAFTSVVISLFNDEHSNIPDIYVKSKILGLCSRGLDLLSIFTIEPIVLRFSCLIGRIFAVVSDYLPDHAIQPDEVLFQGCMLGISALLVLKSALPYARAKLNQMNGKSTGSWRHPVAFKYLFRPAGITPLQFECISSLVEMKWEYYQPSETVLSTSDDENEHLLWVYRGDTHIVFHEEAIPYTRKPANSHQNVSTMYFLADMDFLGEIESMVLGERSSTLMDECSIDPGVCQPLAVVAGPSGARVLKVNKEDMLNLLKANNDIVRPIQNLMSRGVQKKLKTLLSKNHLPAYLYDQNQE